MSDLAVRDLTIEYSSGGYIARPIERLGLDVADGQLVLVLGASGCGKTTLLSALASLLKPTSGTITLGDLDITALSGRNQTEYRRHTVGVVFQAFNLIPSLSALENVAAPLLLAGVRAGTARRRAAVTLEEVDLADRRTHRPTALSGGQQQRVAIARALVHNPTLLLADEPTAHLDYIQVEGVLTLLRSLARPGRSVVVATHDERLLPLADAVIELTPARAAAGRPPQSRTLAAGEVLFEQGDDGDLVYLVERGEIEIVCDRNDGTTEPVTVIGPGGYFGELAPMFRLRRSATSRATVPTTVTGLTPHDFRHLAAPKSRTGSRSARSEGLEPPTF
jgi:putative ABC transport system ATP-binding protein